MDADKDSSLPGDVNFKEGTLLGRRGSAFLLGPTSADVKMSPLLLKAPHVSKEWPSWVYWLPPLGGHGGALEWVELTFILVQTGKAGVKDDSSFVSVLTLGPLRHTTRNRTRALLGHLYKSGTQPTITTVS